MSLGKDTYVLTPKPQVISQVLNWVNSQPKRWITGTTEDNSNQKRRNSRISWLEKNSVIYDMLSGAVNKANKNAGWNYSIMDQDQFQYTEYEVGDYYDWHMDTFRTPTARGVRKISFIMPLNDDYEGGELLYEAGPPDYPHRIRKVDIKVGDILLFPSATWHKVNPVTKGQRRSIVCWYYGKPG